MESPEYVITILWVPSLNSIVSILALPPLNCFKTDSPSTLTENVPVASPASSIENIGCVLFDDVSMFIELSPTLIFNTLNAVEFLSEELLFDTTLAV